MAPGRCRCPPPAGHPSKSAGICRANVAARKRRNAKLRRVRKRLTGEIPLVSRDAEMDWILTRLKRPDPAAFVLAGTAGVGKTRLRG